MQHWEWKDVSIVDQDDNKGLMRMKIPEGWLYKEYCYTDQGRSYTASMCFVPDAQKVENRELRKDERVTLFCWDHDDRLPVQMELNTTTDLFYCSECNKSFSLNDVEGYHNGDKVVEPCNSDSQ